MRIEINGGNWGTYTPLTLNVNNIGLRYLSNTAGTIYDVFDKELFFLSVIKHGITFNEVDESIMKVEIYGNGFGTFNPIFNNLENIGIEYATARKAGVYFKVINKELFFLSVIKYGITFKEVEVKIALDQNSLV